MIRAIAAIDEQRGIAKEGAIPWDIPEDKTYFRNATEGDIVLMGRETYDEFAEPLSGRRNVVVSRSLQEVRSGFELTTNVVSFVANTTEDIWIIGGAGLYESLLDECHELYITHIASDFDCDRFFPAYESSFELVHESPKQYSGDLTFTYAVYKKVPAA